MGIAPKNNLIIRIGIAYWVMLIVVLFLLPTDALAAGTPPESAGVLDEVLRLFNQGASEWKSVIMDAAMFIFWTLGTISLVITYGTMIVRKADIGEFFAETIRFMLFFGFFLWLLRNGTEFAESIIKSLTTLANKASSGPKSPSQVVDVGLKIWHQIWSFDYGPFVWLAAVIIGGICAVILTAVGVNLFLLYAAGYIVVYAGFFVLGFGGSRWTSDIALNYYKTALSIALKLMTMILIIGICANILDKYYASITDWADFRQMFVYLVFCVAFYKIAHSVPDMVAGMVSGGAAGVGNTSAGGAVGAVAGAAASLAGAAVAMKAAAAAVAAKAGGGEGKGNAMEAATKAAGGDSDSGGDNDMFNTDTQQPPPPAKAAQAAQAGGGDSGGGGASSSSGGGDSGGGGGDASSSGGDSSGDSSSDSSGDSSGDSSSQSASSSAGSGGGDASSGGDSPNTDVGGQSDSGGDKGGSKGASGSNKGGGGAGSRALSALSKVDSAIGAAAGGAAAIGGAVAKAGGNIANKAGTLATKAGNAIADPVKKGAAAAAAAAPNLTSALGATARGAGKVGRVASSVTSVAAQAASTAIDERISKTTGGKIAAALNANQEAQAAQAAQSSSIPTSLGNNLQQSTTAADRQAEIDAFVNKHKT